MSYRANKERKLKIVEHQRKLDEERCRKNIKLNEEQDREERLKAIGKAHQNAEFSRRQAIIEEQNRKIVEREDQKIAKTRGVIAVAKLQHSSSLSKWNIERRQRLNREKCRRSTMAKEKRKTSKFTRALLRNGKMENIVYADSKEQKFCGRRTPFRRSKSSSYVTTRFHAIPVYKTVRLDSAGDLSDEEEKSPEDFVQWFKDEVKKHEIPWSLRNSNDHINNSDNSKCEHSTMKPSPTTYRNIVTDCERNGTNIGTEESLGTFAMTKNEGVGTALFALNTKSPFERATYDSLDHSQNTPSKKQEKLPEANDPSSEGIVLTRRACTFSSDDVASCSHESEVANKKFRRLNQLIFETKSSEEKLEITRQSIFLKAARGKSIDKVSKHPEKLSKKLFHKDPVLSVFKTQDKFLRLMNVFRRMNDRRQAMSSEIEMIDDHRKCIEDFSNKISSILDYSAEDVATNKFNENGHSTPTKFSGDSESTNLLRNSTYVDAPSDEEDLLNNVSHC